MKKASYVPLTPDLRSGAIGSLDEGLQRLDSCRDTPYVNMYRCAYMAAKSLMAALPDGYPVPVTKDE